MTDENGPVPGGVLLHPVALGGAALLAFNDFVLKHHAHGWVSGKLSDAAINLVLPMALVAAWEWGTFLTARMGKHRWRPASPPISLAACFITGAYFSALQLWPAFVEVHLRMMSFVFPFIDHEVTPDPADLMTLVMLVFSWVVLRLRFKRWAVEFGDGGASSVWQGEEGAFQEHPLRRSNENHGGKP